MKTHRSANISNQSSSESMQKRHSDTSLGGSSSIKRKRDRKTTPEVNPTKAQRTRSSISPSSRTSDRESRDSKSSVKSPSSPPSSIPNSVPVGPAVPVISNTLPSTNGGNRHSPRDRDKRDREPGTPKEDRDKKRRRNDGRLVDSNPLTTTVTISGMRTNSPPRVDNSQTIENQERNKEKERTLRERIREEKERKEKADKEKERIEGKISRLNHQ